MGHEVVGEGDAEVIEKGGQTQEWVPMKVKAAGPRIQIWIDDVQAVDYTEQDDGIARTGIIGLKSHSGAPAEASYRNIKLKPL